MIIIFYKNADRTVNDIAEINNLNPRTVYKNIKQFPNDSIERVIARIIANQPKKYRYAGRSRGVREISKYIGTSGTNLHKLIREHGFKKAIKIAEDGAKKRGIKLNADYAESRARESELPSAKKKCTVAIPTFNPNHYAENLYNSLIGLGYRGDELEHQFNMRVAA